VKSGAGAGFLDELDFSTEFSAPEADESESEFAVACLLADDVDPGVSYRWMSVMPRNTIPRDATTITADQ